MYPANSARLFYAECEAWEKNAEKTCEKSATRLQGIKMLQFKVYHPLCWLQHWLKHLLGSVLNSQWQWGSHAPGAAVWIMLGLRIHCPTKQKIMITHCPFHLTST